jgi:Gram-negative bacterial TonB protein C-terminal
MMKFWVERYLRTAAPLSSAVVSVAVHAALIGASVAATAGAGVEEKFLPENNIVRFLAPPNRSAGQQPRREMIRYVAIAIPEGTAGGAAVQPIESIKQDEPISGLDERDAFPLPELDGADSVFSVLQVDSTASRYEWSAAPAYPPKMLESKLEGFVEAQWVVDEEGYADTTSIRIVTASHPEFAKSVLDALPFMRFKPAKIGRTTVRQLVQQDFSFRISPPAPDTSQKVARKP